MKLINLYEGVPSPEQQKLYKVVKSVVAKIDSEVNCAIHTVDYGDWIEIKIGIDSCNFRIKGDTLELANMYLPEKLQGKGMMTAILKGLKDTLKLAKCKVFMPMNVAGWKSIVEKSGLAWVEGVTKDEFHSHMRLSK